MSLLLCSHSKEQRGDGGEVPVILVSCTVMLRGMYWILAALLLIVMLAVPRLRPLAAGGIVVLGAMLAWGMFGRVREADPAQPLERGRPTTPAPLLESIPVEQIEVEGLELIGGGAPFRLRGRVHNRSASLLLKSFMLDITRRDCHAEALDPSGCAMLWQGRHWIELTVPPQETREFAVSIWARGDAPRALGTVRDEFEVVTASGQKVEGERD
ncbi:MAG: hypothetical protein C0P74_007110 [Gammaproteobacteria bacterium]|nr:hypothetical protein [Gammaproteobacteria bacterium]